LQLSALRAEFLAEKRDAYDALILRLLQRTDISAVFSYLERSRARTFQDRLGPQNEMKPLTIEEVALGPGECAAQGPGGRPRIRDRAGE
jgi:hypothetical protein